MRTVSQFLLSQVDAVVICPNGQILLILYVILATNIYEKQDKDHQSDTLLRKKEQINTSNKLKQIKPNKLKKQSRNCERN